MRKNGFTLIELLAVIVILAIIALIATPIILGIINDARKESQERSVELYASAIRNGIAAYQLREGKEVVSGRYTSETLPFDVEYDGDVECTTIELYEDGGVYVAGCTVNDLEVDYSYGTKQEMLVYLNDVCTPAENQYFATNPLEAGYKYICTVDPSKPAYTFYILTTVEAPEDAEKGEVSVNLIMDSNILTSGEAIKETKLIEGKEGSVAWVTKDDYTNEEIGGTEEEWDKWCDECGYSDKGPITAMKYLQEATKNWTNTNSQTVSTFTDRGGSSYEMIKPFIANARMPYYSEISDYSADANNAYLYDNLIAYLNSCYDEEGEEIPCDVPTASEGVHEEGMTHVSWNSGVYGYWSLSSSGLIEPSSALYVNYMGWIPDNFVDGNYGDGGIGVRPVINLSI